MKKNTIRILTAVFVTVVCCVVFFCPIFFSRVCVTAVKLPENGSGTKKTLVLPEEAGSEFVISYTHSVNKGRVRDFYTVLDDGSLMLSKSRFGSYGAGMPEPEDLAGQVFVVTDSYLEMQQINQKMPGLYLAVGVIAGHALELLPESGESSFWPLNEYFAPQTRLYISYRRVSVCQLIFSSL